MLPAKVLLYTCGGVAEDFFKGVEPCNLYLEMNKDPRSKILRMLKDLFRFNHVAEMMVERLDECPTAELESPYLRIVDCKLR